MYLSSTDKIQVVLAGAITTNQLQCIASWQDITSAGMTLPQSSSQALTNNTTAVDLVAAPAASTNRQVVHLTVYNADTVAATVTVQKDVSATDYIIIKAVLQTGDTLEWSREAGWHIISDSLQESVILRSYAANDTWTKQAGLKRLIVVCLGAGGGGGSGRQGPAGENRFGGGGGGGGAYVIRQLSESDVTTTVSITIGTGGTKGAAQASTGSNGNAGTAGTDTSFGSYVIAKGGSGGAGGTTANGTGGAGGALNTSTPAWGPFAISGATGGSGGTNAGGNAPSSGFSGSASCPGGSGGGGINSTNTSATTGQPGGGIYNIGTLISGPLQTVYPRDGSNNQATYLLISNTITSGTGIGTGGAGTYPTSPTSINAGNGGNYGAGGGGGTATLNGTTSGAGGNGAGGLCIVMEIY